jgi:UDP-N-acetyl-D-glucosamine dehydrogenase
MKNIFLKKITNLIDTKKCYVGIIGLGYVGLPLSILFAKNNFKIIGFDTDKKKIAKIKKNNSYIDRISNKDINLINKNGNFYSSFSHIRKCDIIIICVPTPLKKNQNPDLSFIKNTINSIKIFLKKGQVLILESTSYPGTTEEEIYQKIKNNFEIGKDFFLGFSSERINPGKNENSIQKIPKVVSGYTKDCLKIISNFYSKSFNEIVESKSIQIAEFSKLLENIYRSVNIGFINEMKILADRMNLDIFDIIAVASTKPYGFRRFFPGPGIGGHCIPVDPSYLYWKSVKVGLPAKFIKLSAQINIQVLNFIIIKISNNLKSKKIPLVKSKILILGLSYKKDLDDIRESASIKLINKLFKKGIKNISAHDPYVDNKISNKKITKIKFLNSKIINSFDIVVLMTDHDIFDYDLIKRNAKLIIDCRGRFEVKDNVQRG